MDEKKNIISITSVNWNGKFIDESNDLECDEIKIGDYPILGLGTIQ